MFHLSPLTTIVAIGTTKPFVKSESGLNLVMYDVYGLAMMILFTGTSLQVSSYKIEIHGIHFQYPDNAHYNINWT